MEKSDRKTMAEKKTILVTGATGAQGGSVARHLLRRGDFAVRALTRDPDSAGARALRTVGAEVVQGDLGDPESLRAALVGAYGVFGVTNFWEHFAREREHGVNLIDAVADSEVEHFVLSTLPHVKQISGGELEVPHFDIKAELEAYAQNRCGRSTALTFVHVAFYYENFLSFFPPRPQKDGTFAFGFPQGDTPLAAFAAEDLGGVVAPLFARPDDFRGRTVGVVGDDRPPAEYARIMTEVLDAPVVYQYVPREVFAGLGFPGAEDLANMFEFNRRFIPNRIEDLTLSRALYPSLQTFEAWLCANRSRFAPILAG